MKDAKRNMDVAKSEYDRGGMSYTTYLDAVSMDILAYCEQLDSMPEPFWKSVKEEDMVIINAFSVIRNNLAHAHLADRFNVEFMANTFAQDLYRVHKIVLEFASKEDLEHRADMYVSDRRGKLINGRPPRDNSRYPIPGTISKNLKSGTGRRVR